MRQTCCVVIMVLGVSLPVSAQSYRGEGAALGGIAGAIAGGIIGHQNDETPEGALIGGAVGAITGGLIGNSKDKQVAREQMYRERIWYQQQQLAQQQQVSVTNAEIIGMCRSGVSDAVVINHIHTNGVRSRLATHDIISLHQQGVSEVVINAIQRAPIRDGSPTIQSVSVPPATVIVEEHYAPPVYVRPYHGHGPYYYRAYNHAPGYHCYHRF